MGLDNGIIIKVKPKMSLIVQNLLNDVSAYSGADKYEVTYWRKCWGVRDDIIELLREPGDTKEKYYFDCNTDDIRDIIDLLTDYDVNNWNNNLWDWEDYGENIGKQINALRVLLWVMRNYSDDIEEVYFYDSY